MKRTYRIDRNLGLQLRNKTSKRRVKAKLRDERQEPVGPNDVRAIDFVHDQLARASEAAALSVAQDHRRQRHRRDWCERDALAAAGADCMVSHDLAGMTDDDAAGADRHLHRFADQPPGHRIAFGVHVDAQFA